MAAQGAATEAGQPAGSAAEPPVSFGFVIDNRKCIGCHACTVACKAENGVPLNVFRTWVKVVEAGAFGTGRRHFQVTRCNHCANAPCVTACPTRALFTRPDGIVDFNPARCIGCRACMHACPYDALYLDPVDRTAAKCNFCAPRVDAGLLPACVIACPTKAIVAGDLNDPASEIVHIVGREPVSVRRPDQRTVPKLFYVDASQATLDPLLAYREPAYQWSDRPSPDEEWQPPLPPPQPADSAAPEAAPRLAYDVEHPRPWGARVAASLWTRALGTGALLVAALLVAAGAAGAGPPSWAEFWLLGLAAPGLSLGLTLLTAALLAADLTRPGRCLRVLTAPNPRSWLARSAFLLLLVLAVAATWLGFAAAGSVPAPVVATAIVVALLAVLAGARLFAQLEGRDLWQNPLTDWQALAQALVGGAALCLPLAALGGADELAGRLAGLLAAALAMHALAVACALIGPQRSQSAAEAAYALIGGRYRNRFWGLVAAGGTLLPLLLLIVGLAPPAPALAPVLPTLASPLALVGLWTYHDLWLRAGQLVPQS